jgi:hypothetical protein
MYSTCANLIWTFWSQHGIRWRRFCDRLHPRDSDDSSVTYEVLTHFGRDVAEDLFSTMNWSIISAALL